MQKIGENLIVPVPASRAFDIALGEYMTDFVDDAEAPVAELNGAVKQFRHSDMAVPQNGITGQRPIAQGSIPGVLRIMILRPSNGTSPISSRYAS